MSAHMLTIFCANKWEIRDALRSPFTKDGWTYFTNAHVIARVPASIGGEALTFGPMHPKNAAVLFDRWIPADSKDFSAFPPMPETSVCHLCGGAGELRDEWGDLDQCPKCFGSGKAWTYFALGDAGFNLLYLRQLAYLPNARIRTNGKTDPAVVLFDDGQALVMPMRER